MATQEPPKQNEAPAQPAPEKQDEVVIEDKKEQHEPKVDEAQKMAETFDKYIKESGLKEAFQIIFAEILTKKIPDNQVFIYAAMRLKQIGSELAQIASKKSNDKSGEVTVNASVDKKSEGPKM